MRVPHRPGRPMTPKADTATVGPAGKEQPSVGRTVYHHHEHEKRTQSREVKKRTQSRKPIWGLFMLGGGQLCVLGSRIAEAGLRLQLRGRQGLCTLEGSYGQLRPGDSDTAQGSGCGT